MGIYKEEVLSRKIYGKIRYYRELMIKEGDYLFCIKGNSYKTVSGKLVEFKIGDKCKVENIRTGRLTVSKSSGESMVLPLASCDVFFETLDEHRKRIIDNLS